MSRKAPVWAIAAASVVALAGVGVNADTLSPPHWINGSGNPQDNFTVRTNTSEGIELGLRAKYRYNPATITPTGTTPTYTVVAGPQTNQTSGGNGTSTRTAWNYEYSINLNPTGETSGFKTLSEIFANLTVTDPNGHSATVDVLDASYTTDNTGYGFASDGITPERHTVALDSDWLAQNSENPSFVNFPVASFFNQNTTGTSTFTLEVGNTANHVVLATDTIKVDVVPTPLPSTALAGLGLLGGVGVMGGRRRRHRQPV
jgi:hypothetical protein